MVHTTNFVRVFPSGNASKPVMCFLVFKPIKYIIESIHLFLDFSILKLQNGSLNDILSNTFI